MMTGGWQTIWNLCPTCGKESKKKMVPLAMAVKLEAEGHHVSPNVRPCNECIRLYAENEDGAYN